uniref:UDENN FLCN/SMCR8-type domain-containing protein n=1 Tax=Parascaris univalens TaxID=6257 RepID=A0A914ZU45_PARUN
MSTASVDELLTPSKKSVDPFNRLSCCTEPVLVVIEFCQVQGPRPLHWVPEIVDPHLDLDSVAIWLMSSEVVNGSTVMVYNQQMAIHACVHHSTILDIRARGFQRQLSIALLMATKPTTSLFRLFIDISRQLLSPILMCNRRLFKQHLSHLINVSDSIQRCSFNNYYALYADLALSPTSAARVESVAVQARRLLPRFQAAYNSLSHSKNGAGCGQHIMDDIDKCLDAIGNPHVPLLPINHLAPCMYDHFVKLLTHSRDFIMKELNKTSNGALFCAHSPILKLSHFSAPPPACADELLRLLSDTYEDKEEALKAIICNLANILYAMLSGERLAICASEQRQVTAMDLLRKLNLLRVAVQRQALVWSDNPHVIPQDCQIFGESLSRSESATWIAEGVGAVLDMNGHTIRCKEYSGVVLRSLAKKRPRSFPSDRSIITYVIALLTDFCALVYMAKYGDVRKLTQVLSLSTADVNILASFLAEVDFLRKWITEMNLNVLSRVTTLILKQHNPHNLSEEVKEIKLYGALTKQYGKDKKIREGIRTIRTAPPEKCSNSLRTGRERRLPLDT